MRFVWLLSYVVVCSINMNLTVDAAVTGDVLTSLTPSATIVASTSITVAGSTDGAKVGFVLEGAACPITPDLEVSSSVVTFVPPAVGTYDVCYQTTGDDVLKQTAAGLKLVVGVATADNVVSSLTPTSITDGIPTEITVAGGTDGDKVGLVLAAVACPAVHLVVTGGKITFTPPAEEIYKVCYEASGKLVTKQTTPELTVVSATGAAVVTMTAPDPPMKAGVEGTIALGGATEGKVVFHKGTDCATSKPVTSITGNQVTVTLTQAGTHILCYQKVGGTDSVKQTGITLEVEGTADIAVTKIDPSSISSGITSTITLEGASIVNGDKAFFVAKGTDCTAPDILVGDNKALTLPSLSAGEYDLCYRAKGHVDMAKQNDMKLTVVAATLATVVTAISTDPTNPVAESEVTVTMVGDIASGDKVALTTKEDCTDAVPDIAVDHANKKFTYTPSVEGTYIMCYQQTGGTDSVKQAGIKVLVVKKVLQTSGVTRLQVSWTSGLALVFGLHLAFAHRL